MLDSEIKEAVQAGKAGNVEALYETIQRNPYVLERIDQVPFIDTPLHSAAYHGSLGFVLEMINLKPSFARKLNQAGFSPMHLALQTGNDPIVLRLLKFDKDLVRVKGKEGMTPLHQAVQIGNLDILFKFLQACPEAIQDVNIREQTAFHIALIHDEVEAFKVLVGWLRRSCHKAAQSWEKELLISGDFEGNTVLHIAVTQSRPSVEVVKLLLENFSHDQINAKNSKDLTALDMIAPLENEREESKSDNGEIYDMLTNAGLIGSWAQKMPNSSVGCSIRSLLLKVSTSPAGGLIRSFFLEKPESSTNIDSLKSKMSYHSKLKTAIARGRTGISEETRNIFLVVTVLIITATYGASLNPPKKESQDGGNGSGTGKYSSSSSSSASSSGQGSASASASSWASSGGNSGGTLGIQLPDVYSLFWLYNTLTFWASVWLTAFLLPRRSSICLFLLTTLSLFGSCYMLLIVAVSSDLGSYSQLFSKDPDRWYYSISVVNYILSTLLAFLVAYRIARFVCLKLAKSRRVLLCLILLGSFLLVVLSILFPAMLFSEIMWRNFFPRMYNAAAEPPKPSS